MIEGECYLCGSRILDGWSICFQCVKELENTPMTVYKECKIEIAHKIEGHEKCGNIHGHTVKVIVGIRGIMNPESGMVIDFNTVKHYMQKEIIDRFDHKYLNDTMPIPTAEFLAFFIFNKLNYSPLVSSGHRVVMIRVHETENNYVEYTGNDDV